VRGLRRKEVALNRKKSPVHSGEYREGEHQYCSLRLLTKA
jgi:hypothetical protein